MRRIAEPDKFHNPFLKTTNPHAFFPQHNQSTMTGPLGTLQRALLGKNNRQYICPKKQDYILSGVCYPKRDFFKLAHALNDSLNVLDSEIFFQGRN